MSNPEHFHNNIWRYWRPIYRFTWAYIQKTSYQHYCRHLSQGQRQVLDIGTGTGVYIKNLPKQNNYHFSDIDPKSLEKAKSQAMEYLSIDHYNFIHGDALSSIASVKSIDLISLIHVISVVPNPDEVIQAAIEKLNPGGELLIYISSLSKMIPTHLQDGFKALGFRALKLDKVDIDWEVIQVSTFNECYLFRKNL
jgi:SAM-dependent methyltransferase